MEPTIITYTGDGKTKTFRFGFSFFNPADIVVEINGEPATIQYALQTAKPNPTADMPYHGGAVCFATAPAADTAIKIYREFVMVRPGDFQPTAEIEQEQLNREFNFNLENMKDFRNRQKNTDTSVQDIKRIIENVLLNDSDNTTPVPDTPDMPPIDTSEIETKIANLESNIATLTAQLETRASQSDITQIQSTITALNTDINNTESNISELTNQYTQLVTAIENINTHIMPVPDWESGINKGTSFIADQNGIIIIKCNRGAYSKISLKINNVLIYEPVPDTAGTNGLLYAGPFPVATGDIISISGNNSPQATFYPYRNNEQ